MKTLPVFSWLAFCAAIGCALAICGSGLYYPSIFAYLAGVWYSVLFFITSIVTESWGDVLP